MTAVCYTGIGRVEERVVSGGSGGVDGHVEIFGFDV